MMMTVIRSAVITAALIVGAWAILTAPSGPRVVQFETTAPDYSQVELDVEQQQDALEAGWTCYADPSGHEPTSAVVKDDGGTTAYRLSFDEAWAASQAGEVWILSWCER